MSRLTTPLAILVGSVVISAALLSGNLINRYREANGPGVQAPYVLRLDTVTGEICLYNLFTQVCGAARLPPQ
jgi:hypothetical protein